MPTEVTPQKLQEAVRIGFKRMKNFRSARMMFLKNYHGQYYDADKGNIGDQPLNMIFSAISVLVPNLVMQFPKHVVTSTFLAYKDYAELLGLALDHTARDVGLKDTMRKVIVDSFFCLGILKTGLCESKSVISFSDRETLDPGSIYTETVDIDDFTFDPSCRNDFREGAFLGDRIRIPRMTLLDSGLYRNDLIEKLPSSATDLQMRDRAESLSMDAITPDQADDLHDTVDVVELWIPKAHALVTVPSSEHTADDYLRVADYYGPDSGPYTFLTLTPPVPNNPLPIAPVAIWNDLHILANRMAKKLADQADRQKDLLGYRRAAADDAQDILDAEDGAAVAMDDPAAVANFSFGGQNPSNERYLAQLDMWFNRMAGNIEALGGMQSQADTATEAQLLQANGSIRIEDMRGLVYSCAADEARKRAWYLHTDPLIQLPLIKRQQKPAQYALTTMGPIMAEAPSIEQVQVLLTPEMRRGDFLDYNIDVELKSMSRMDPAIRLQRMMNFAVQVLPAASTAAQVCMQMGVPFSFSKFVTRMAREMDIDWLDEVFYDPEFQMGIQQLMMKMPDFQSSKGQPAPVSNAGMMQNGQPPQIGAPVQNSTIQNTIQTGLAGQGQANLPNKGGF